MKPVEPSPSVTISEEIPGDCVPALEVIASLERQVVAEGSGGETEEDADPALPSLSIGHSSRFDLIFLCRVTGQLLLLCPLYYIGVVIAQVSHLPLPGNLVGLLLLLALLQLEIVPLAAVADAANLALRYLGLLFVPYVVGIMAWSSLLVASGLLLGVSLVGSAAIGIAVAGVSAQRVMRRSS